MIRFVAFVLLLLALPARANLGETVAECSKRYGKFYNYTEANAKTPFGTIVFIAGPYEMIVFIYGGVEVGARISKNDKTDLGPGEIKNILNADAPMPWTPTPGGDPTSPQWSRADKATAGYDPAKKMLIFTTPDMVKALDAGSSASAAPATPASAEPPKPPGNFAPATPTQWASPTAPSTNAPATNAPPQ